MTKEVLPHIHQNLINLWAADPTIEFDYRESTNEHWSQCGAQPMWRPYHLYRVRPKPQVAKYLMVYSDHVGQLGFSVNYYTDVKDFQSQNIGRDDKWVQMLTETKRMFDE